MFPMNSEKLLEIYYSFQGYWKGLAAVKKLAEVGKVFEEVTRVWLRKQALWQVYLPAPLGISGPKFDLPTSNNVHQANLFSFTS